MVRMNSPTLIGELFQSSQVIHGFIDNNTMTNTGEYTLVPPYQLFLLLDIVATYANAAVIVIQWKETVFWVTAEFRYIYHAPRHELSQ